MKLGGARWLGFFAAAMAAVACGGSDGDSFASSDGAPAGGTWSEGGSGKSGTVGSAGSGGSGTNAVGGGSSQGAGGSFGASGGSPWGSGGKGGGSSWGAGGGAGGPNPGSSGAAGAWQPGGSAGGAGSPQGAAGAGGSSAGAAGAAAGAAGEAGQAGAGGDAGQAGAPSACAGLDQSQPKTIFVSADDSNSMASPALARRLIKHGQNPPPQLIRTFEFLNYYNVPYQAPAEGQLAIVPQLRSTKEGSLELQIGVQSPPAASPRRPMNITFVLDTSGSMTGEPMTHLKESVKAMATQLRSGDIVSVTTWNDGSSVALSGLAVAGPSDPTLLSVIDGLSAGGGTDLHGGLVAGYDLAKQNYAEDRVNRVVVISDGVANVGITDEQMIGKESDVENKEGIYLVGIGVGDGVNDTLLNVVTDAGNGAYLYIDTGDEAQKMLAGRFDEVMGIAARDVRISMTVPWYLAITKFSGEQYSTDPTKVKPQNLAPGDAMVVNQTLKACDSSLIAATDPLSFKATWVEPQTYALRSAEVKTSVGELLAADDAQLRRGRAIVAYADALRSSVKSCSDRKQAVDGALALVDQADPTHNDPGLAEIGSLLESFRDLCP